MQLKILRWFCTLKSIFFNINFFIIFISNMCKYTHKRHKLLKNKEIPQGGCATLLNVPKLGVSGVEDTAKTNKDWGMSCYIQVEYSVCFYWNLTLWPYKNWFKIYLSLGTAPPWQEIHQCWIYQCHVVYRVLHWRTNAWKGKNTL